MRSGGRTLGFIGSEKRSFVRFFVLKVTSFDRFQTTLKIAGSLRGVKS